jgi:hypothetical protein
LNVVVDPAVQQEGALTISDMAASVEYVPLETTDE